MSQPFKDKNSYLKVFFFFNSQAIKPTQFKKTSKILKTKRSKSRYDIHLKAYKVNNKKEKMTISAYKKKNDVFLFILSSVKNAPPIF